MKAVSTIIVTLAIASYSLTAEPQSTAFSNEDEALLSQHFEQMQNQLERQHLDALKNSIQNKIDTLISHINQSIIPEINYASNTEPETTVITVSINSENYLEFIDLSEHVS